MSIGGEPGHLHRAPDGSPITTSRHRYLYFFYDKHHGRGGKGDAQWARSLTGPEEFGVFDLADEHDLADDDGNLYGSWIGLTPDGPPHRIFELGTREQQIAKFWAARENEPWHGFPLWPRKDLETPNRTKEKYRPPKSVFEEMREAGLINISQRRRLLKGDPA